MVAAVRTSITAFNSGSGSTTMVFAGLAVNAGELLVFQLSDRDATQAISSVIGSLNGAYTLSRAAQISGNFRAVQYYLQNSAGGTETLTITFAGNVRGVGTLSACTGVKTTGVLGNNNGATNAAGTSHSCGSMDAVAGLTFATFNFSGEEGAKTHTGYTEITNAHTFARDYFSYRVNPGAETITSTVTTTNSVSGVGYHVNYLESDAALTLAVDHGEQALEGQASTFGVGLVATHGELALEGFDVDLLADEEFVLPVVHQGLALEGQEIPFSYSQPGTHGELALQGSDVTLLANLILPVDHGQLCLGGENVVLDLPLTIPVIAGQLALMPMVIGLTLTGDDTQDATPAYGLISTCVTTPTQKRRDRGIKWVWN